MKKWVMQIHIYTGLLFFGFLIEYGFSSLVFNHPKAFDQERTTVKWDQPISTLAQTDPWQYATAVQADLGLDGRLLHPEFSKRGDLDFDVARPGRHYSVHLKGKSVHVDESRAGTVVTLSELHGVRAKDTTRILNVWAWYSLVGAVVLVISTITGVYLWAIRRRERILGWATLVGATSMSLAICLYLWARG